MASTRRALLISNPGEVGDEHYCKGVPIDIANYRRFLTQAIGGYWQSTEIIVRDRPSADLVRQEVKALADFDYSFVAFAGHGWYSSTDKATVLTLRKGEKISSLELLKGTTKRTIILDCCREIRNETALQLSALTGKMVFAAERHRRQPVPQLCREKFFGEVTTASNASVTLHSCSPGETSGDDQVVGGRYTSSLIISGDVWAEKIADSMYSKNAEAYSVVAALDAAEISTKNRSGGSQTPYADKPRTERNYFPFAVFA